MELSLPTTVFSAFVGSTVLLMALIYISKTPGAPRGVNYWIIGIALTTVRYSVILWVLMTRQLSMVFIVEALQVVGAFYLVAGSLVFLGKRVRWNLFIGICVAAVGWAAYTTLVVPNFLLRSIPLYLVSGCAVVWVGYTFIQARHIGEKTGYEFTGALYILWGIHKLDYPLLRPVEWFAPYGFLIAMILFMSIAISLIVITQRYMLLASEQEFRGRRKAEAALRSSEGRYQRLFENSEMSIWNEDMSGVVVELARLREEGVTDLRQYLENDLSVAWDIASKVKVVHVNESTLKLFGARDENEFIYQIDKFFGPEAIEVFIDELCAIWDKRSFFRAEAAHRTIEGKHLDCIISFLIPDTVEGFNSIPVTVLDITERKLAEESLRISEARYRDLVENIPDLLYRTDNDGRISYVSGSVYALSGYTVDEAIGMKMAEEVYAEPEIREALLAGLKEKGQGKNFEAQLIRKDGSTWWGSANARLVKGDDGSILGVEGIVRDISEQKSIEEQLSFQASHDILTGLINRDEFENRANRLLSTIQYDGAEHAVCFLDLDQFKVVNDTCGHVAGDELLRQLGRLLRDTVRKRDTLARLGGDEFGVLMEHCTLEQAHRVADDILKVIMDYQFFWEGSAFRIGVSIGLVAITEANSNFTELFKQADAACYLAKDLGRNRIHAYHPDDTELAVRHGEMQWVGRISQALDEDRFCLFAQPIISLDGGGRRHYELLVRMLDEQGDIILPSAFLPAAERYNLVEKLDAWVVSHACTFLAKQPAFINQIDFVTINLSGPSLTNQNFLDSILHIFNETGVSPGKVCFEVTETVAVSNLGSAIDFITNLKKTGCRFALDDFGSGLSSFGYLKNLPVDYLKIDGMFVKDIVEDPIDYAMVKSINEIGQVMGMKTIAEFVENDEIKAMLKAIGVNYGQGYGMGKPEPLIGLITQTDKT